MTCRNISELTYIYFTICFMRFVRIKVFKGKLNFFNYSFVVPLITVQYMYNVRMRPI